MARLPKAVVPTVVIICLLIFFVFLVILVTLHRLWVMRQKRMRRQTQSDQSRQSIKKLTIEKGRVVSMTETLSQSSPRSPKEGRPLSFWSIRRVPISSSIDPSDRFSSHHASHKSKRPSTLADRWSRRNIDSIISGRGIDAHDLAEKGELDRRVSFLSPKSPELAAQKIHVGRDQSMDLRLREDDYREGVRMAPLTTTRAVSKPAPKILRARTPSGHGPSLGHQYGQPKPGRPGLHVPTLDRKQVLFPSSMSDMEQVFDSLENAPPSRKSRQGLLRGPLASLGRTLSKGSTKSRERRRNLTAPSPRPNTRGKESSLLTRRIMSSQERSGKNIEVKAYVPKIQPGPSRRAMIDSTLAGRDKVLPVPPGERASRQRSLKVYQPSAIRATMSPRTVEKFNNMLVSIPGSPTESRLYLTDEDEEADAFSEISRLRPLSYVSSKRSRNSHRLPHKLSLASLGPDLRGFRKSIAPSMASSLTPSVSPDRRSKQTSPERPVTNATHTDWLDTEFSDDDASKPEKADSKGKKDRRSQSDNRASRRKSWHSLYDVSDVSSISAPAPTKAQSGQHSRGLSNFSARSFGTVSSLNDTYGLAEAVPVRAPPAPKRVTAVPTQPGSSLAPPVPLLPTQQRISRPPPITVKRLSQALPPSPPVSASSIKRTRDLVNQNRRSRPQSIVREKSLKSLKTPPLDLRLSIASGARSSRLLKGPVSPMSARTTESLRRQSSMTQFGYTSGTETSVDEKENTHRKMSVKSEPVKRKAVGKRPPQPGSR